MAALHKILIAGGGTAGWLTANYLASVLHAASQQNVQIQLVESADIGILGVGEGTFPSIRGTLSAIGMDEARFLRGATATFKQGIRFVDWVRAPGAPGTSACTHAAASAMCIRRGTPTTRAPNAYCATTSVPPQTA